MTTSTLYKTENSYHQSQQQQQQIRKIGFDGYVFSTVRLGCRFRIQHVIYRW